MKMESQFLTSFIVILTMCSTMADPIPLPLPLIIPIPLYNSFSKFAVQLHQQCVAEKGGNVIISPLSIQTALSLTLMGATGETAKEMSTVMGYGNLDRNAIAAEYATLLSTYKNSTTLKIANKIYVQENYHVKPQFNEIAEKIFNSETQSLNFADNTNAAKTINTWVEDKTNNTIKDLVSPRDLDENTRMVLVNAIHFKGWWKNQFIAEDTKKKPFWTTKDKSVDVDMMHTQASFKYGVFNDLKARALEMPYNDSDSSMLIILPDERDGLADLEEALGNMDLSDITKNMSIAEVLLDIPKFKFEFKIHLKPILSQMGMSKMFSADAEFGDLIENQEHISVSKVIHKAFIDVNEAGTEAAAATAVITAVKYSGGPTEHIEFMLFTVDHPFFFAILNKSSNSIFSGRVASFAQ